MKIAVFEIEDWERDVFSELEEDHEVVYVAEPLGEDNVDRHADAEVISTFIYFDLSSAVLERMQELRLIATRSTGVNHIDTEHCERHGIRIANVPSYGKNTVAEHTFALLLSISHRLVDAVDRTRHGDFSSEGLQGFDLRGKTLGVVGTGDIGRWVIRIAKGFGMQVVAFDTKPDEDVARELGFRYAGLDELLSASDVVTLHVPLNEGTEHLIGREQIEKMKDGAVLLNTARGKVVDEKALAEALARGKLGAAGLDVLPQEPALREEAELLRRASREKADVGTLLADEALLRMPNAVVTPHNAFNTREAVQRILDTTVENITSFARGEATAER